MIQTSNSNQMVLKYMRVKLKNANIHEYLSIGTCYKIIIDPIIILFFCTYLVQ